MNVNDLKNLQEIEEKFKKLFEMNDKAKGGSKYLQAKVKNEFIYWKKNWLKLNILLIKNKDLSS